MSYDEMQDALAARMMRSAREERKAAKARDGYHPGGNQNTKRSGGKRSPVTAAGIAARAILAAEPGITARELAARSGISASTAGHLIRASR